MTCTQMRDRMSDDPQAFMADPEAQAHLAGCPQCRSILETELAVRGALSALAERRRPEISPSLLARLHAIPFEAEAREELSLSLGSASFHERAQCAAFGLWPFGAAVDGCARWSSPVVEGCARPSSAPDA